MFHFMKKRREKKALVEREQQLAYSLRVINTLLEEYRSAGINSNARAYKILITYQDTTVNAIAETRDALESH